MAEFTEDLSDEELLGICLAFGAAIGMTVGFSIGFINNDLLMWAPMGTAIGVSMGLLFWIGVSDQTDF
ncbi:hypothetical protein [Natronosalvus amylolyticus]|uniref:hypothetical protein n=1 Tax=Natronosalvus amylolyticus TaxID=2961994 RepID=UPI0020C99F85|nr:hypothetical protein [Natronosalvus amylolyticus]